MKKLGISEDLASLSLENKKLNHIIWDFDKSLGAVSFPKGNLWNTIGIFDSGTAYVYSEEALFLAENYNFRITDSNLNALSLKDLVRLNDLNCGFASFALYKILKKHGYILLRPECKYFLKPRLFESLRGEYSLFKPSSTFKKTSPSGLIGRVLEIRNCDKIDDIIKRLEGSFTASILALSDNSSSFCFLEAAIIQPFNITVESGNTQKKQSKFQKSDSN